MSFDGGAVQVKSDFTDNRAQLQDVILRLIYHDDLDGDGIPDTPDVGTAVRPGRSRVHHLQHGSPAVGAADRGQMLRPLPEQKSLIYFASGLRLNGVDNQAQLRATVNAALRANVTIHPIDARGLVAHGAARRRHAAVARRHRHVQRPDCGRSLMNFQRSQDTLYALAKDTGGNAMFDYNDSVARHRAGGGGDEQLLHHRLLQHPHGPRRQVPQGQSLAERRICPPT